MVVLQEQHRENIQEDKTLACKGLESWKQQGASLSDSSSCGWITGLGKRSGITKGGSGELGSGQVLEPTPCCCV